MKNTNARMLTLSFILGLALFVRTLNLDLNPLALSNDEIYAAYNSVSLAQTGQDLGGQPWYHSAFFTAPHYTMTEMQAVITAPWTKALGSSPFTVRLFYALVGTLSVLIFYLCASKLTNSAIALIAALLLAVSPWHIHLSRLGFDGLLSSLFLLIGLTILLRTQRWRTLFSVPFFILSFHTYHATKINLLPFIVITIVYIWTHVAEKRKYLVMVLLAVALWIACYTPLFLNQSAAQNRVGELANLQLIEQTVQQRRQNSLLPHLNQFFINKVTITLFLLSVNFINFFNPQMLFLAGEGSAIFSLWNHGFFYPLDFIFIIAGAVLLYRKQNRLAIFLTAALLCSILPSVLNLSNQSYAMRSFNAVYWLIIPIAYAFWQLTQLHYAKLLMGTVIVIYTFLFANYLFIYHALYPTQAAKAFLVSDRVLARYISLLPQEQPVTVIGNEPRNYLVHYAYYSQIDPIQVQSQWGYKQYKLKNITFTSDCSQINGAGVIIVHKDSTFCRDEQKTSFSAYTSDLEDTWNVMTASACTHSKNVEQFSFPNYPTYKNLDTMPLDQLCTNFFKQKAI